MKYGNNGLGVRKVISGCEFLACVFYFFFPFFYTLDYVWHCRDCSFFLPFFEPCSYVFWYPPLSPFPCDPLISRILSPLMTTISLCHILPRISHILLSTPHHLFLSHDSPSPFFSYLLSFFYYTCSVLFKLAEIIVFFSFSRERIAQKNKNKPKRRCLLISFLDGWKWGGYGAWGLWLT